MKILSDLPGNSRYTMMAEPLWAVFGGMILFYAPLYMKEIGLTEVEMGILNTLNLFIAFICHMLAAPITNRFGRKRTTLVFDIVAWSIPMLIWACAQNFWYFMAASVINASLKIVIVSWNSLLTEDADDSKRAKIYGIIYAINYTTGIFTPVAGLIISRYGTVSTMRVLYVLGFISMTSMFFIRNKLVTETQAGRELMKKHKGLSIAQGIGKYVTTVARVYKSRQIVLISFIYIIMSFVVSLNFFQVIYLKVNLGFKDGEMSLIPATSAILNISLYFLVLPRLRKYSEENTLIGSLVICAAGAFMFLFIPERNILFLLSTTSLTAVGNFLAQTYRDTVFMNRLGEHEKADMYSAVQTLTTLACIPSGYIAGYIYSIRPLLPFITMFVLLIAGIFVSILLHNDIKRNSITGRCENRYEKEESYS